MHTFTRMSALVLGLVLVPAAWAHAQSQAFSVSLGYFAVVGEDSRDDNDVLRADLSNELPLAFEIKDFNSATVGAEWLVGVGDFVEAGVGVGFYRRTVPSVYATRVNASGAEIEQDLKLRIVPLSATVRLLPLGRSAGFQPYIGGGLGLLNWRYSETGEFVDAVDSTIFRESYIADGTDAGPIILGGLRAPFGNDWAAGFEVRYQRAKGNLPSDFLGERIDLGGYSYQVTFAKLF